MSMQPNENENTSSVDVELLGSSRYKKVSVSCHFLQQMMTQDANSTDWEVQCTHGLPADARLIYCAVYWGNSAPVVGIIFEHPDWPEVEPGGNIPDFVPTFTQQRRIGSGEEMNPA